MTSSALLRGDGWVLCSICFERHEQPYLGLYVDAAGARWDVCKGECADEAGLVCDDLGEHDYSVHKMYDVICSRCRRCKPA